MSNEHIENSFPWLAYGDGDFPQGKYYEGDQDQWKDALVPTRPSQFYTYSPNPDRPTFADWQFDGHDGDNSSWIAPA